MKGNMPWVIWFSMLSAVSAQILEERETFRIKEGLPGNSLIGQIRRRPGYTYELNEESEWFSFDSESGEIRTRSTLDRERLEPAETVDGASVLELIVFGDSPAYLISVRVLVEDINDNSPRFNIPFHNATISEAAPIGFTVALPTANDADIGENGRIAQYLLDGGGQEVGVPFELQRTSDDALFLRVWWFCFCERLSSVQSWLQVTETLDREVVPSYSFTVIAVDAGGLRGQMALSIHLLDANDNAPTFDESTYYAVANESTPLTSPIVQVEATDPDAGNNGVVVYKLFDDQFQIDSTTGLVTSKVDKLRCDRQNKCADEADLSCTSLCLFTVEAWDRGKPAQRGRAFVHLTLLDENDHWPAIRIDSQSAKSQQSSSSGRVSVLESARVGSVVGVVTLADEDLGANGRVDLDITAGNSLGHFSLDRSAGPFTLVRIAAKLDRLNVPFYNITLSASDNGRPKKVTKRQLFIQVADADDTPLVFEERVHNVVLEVSLPKNSFVVSVHASKRHRSDVGTSYEITKGNENGFFEINKKTGLVITGTTLWNATGNHQLSLKATNVNSLGVTESTTSTVNVQVVSTGNIVDAPRFSRSDYNVGVLENSQVPLHIVDLDLIGNRSAVRFTFDDQLDSRNFAFDVASESLLLAKPLDRETTEDFKLIIHMVDNLSGKTLDSALVHLMVVDVNDNIPIFDPEEYHLNLVRSTLINGERIQIQLTATDEDMGQAAELSYQLLSSPSPMASISGKTGLLTIDGRKVLEHAKHGNDEIRLTVGAKDGDSLASENPAKVILHVVTEMSHTPNFTESSYEFSFEEDSPLSDSAADRIVGRVSAIDSEEVSPGLFLKAVEYRIIAGNSENLFEVGKYSGEIRSRTVIDRESLAPSCCSLAVAAIGVSGSTTTRVKITVEDVNDNWPTFVSSRISSVSSTVDASVGPEAYVGMPILNAMATDQDLEQNGKVNYRYSPKEHGIINIDSNGLITLVKLPFFLANDSYNFEVVASDAGKPPLSSSFVLQLSVSRRNNQDCEDMVFYIPEDTLPNTIIGSVSVNYTASSFASTVTYSVVHSTSDYDLVSVFPNGQLYVKQALDYEDVLKDEILVKILEYSPEFGETVYERRVTVFITDVNDNKPTCEGVFRFDLLEELPPLSYIGTVDVLDRDSGLNGRVVYYFAEQYDKFHLDPNTGDLFSLATFDHEKMVDAAVFHLSIIAKDQSPDEFSTECAIEVRIVDANDNAPVFTLDVYATTVDEDETVGSTLVSVTATDQDVGKAGSVSYAIQNLWDTTPFSINETSGQLILKKALDREMVQSYALNVSAQDNAEPYHVTYCIVSIAVRDINDNRPIFDAFPNVISVSESTRIGSEIGQVHATDSDSGQSAKVKYAIASENDNDIFFLDPSTGLLYLVGSLDYERVTTHSLVIIASDMGNPQLSSRISIAVNVQDENDNAPSIETKMVSIIENSPVNKTFAKLMASDSDSNEAGKVNFLIKEQFPEDAFGLTPLGGLYPLKKPNREAMDSYRLLIGAYDSPKDSSRRHHSERWISIVVEDENDNSPKFVGAKGTSFHVDSARSERRIAKMFAVDPDSGSNGTVSFNLRQQSEDDQLFTLSKDGSLFLSTSGSQTLSWKPIYLLNIEATDSADLAPKSTRG